jgi:hypothetical protein
MLKTLFIFVILALAFPANLFKQSDAETNMTLDVKEEVRKQLNLQPNEEILIQNVTSKAPMQIKGIEFYESQYHLEKDPVSMANWILVDGKKLYWGDNMLKILEEKKLFPKTKEEALNYANLIVFARGDVVHSDIKYNVPEPVVNEKEAYFEVVLYVRENPKMRNARLVKYIFKLSDGIYEMNKENKTFG